MEGSVIDLSKYRLQSAEENLVASKTLLNAEQYKSSVNRSYYALFHALRAVTALDGFDSSKHSGIIAFFNRTYVKEGIFDKSLSKYIDVSFRLRAWQISSAVTSPQHSPLTLPPLTSISPTALP